tara:strand:- start:39 stop:233 length:195 start_codon:yes stop_codon:yes gene_type:complete
MKRQKIDVKLPINQTIDVTSSLNVIDNSFAFKTAEDINHLCLVLKNQAKEGSDIQGYIHIKTRT